MKKYQKFIWSGIAAIAIGGFAAFNASLNSQNGLSTIHKANVEALAVEGDPCNPCNNLKWSSEKPCTPHSGTYQICEQNGLQNPCSSGGSKTCDCGSNCNN
jgi:hypothetical protein